MQTAHPEFSRPVTLANAARQGHETTIGAETQERAGLVRRFGLVSLERLEASIALDADGPVVMAKGRILAMLEQACCATGEPIAVALDEEFAIRFEPEPLNPVPDDEIELAADDCDVMHYEGGAIDLGEAVAQTLLLSLDPYPRHPDADAWLAAKGVKSEAEAGAFGALAALKDKLKEQN